MSNWEKPLGLAPDFAGSIILLYRSSLIWEHLGISQEELGSDAEERDIWVRVLDLLHLYPTMDM